MATVILITNNTNMCRNAQYCEHKRIRCFRTSLALSYVHQHPTRTHFAKCIAKLIWFALFVCNPERNYRNGLSISHIFPFYSLICVLLRMSVPMATSRWRWPPRQRSTTPVVSTGGRRPSTRVRAKSMSNIFRSTSKRAWWSSAAGPMTDSRYVVIIIIIS